MAETTALLPLVQKFFEKDLVGAARSLETMPEEQVVEVLRTLPPAVAARAVRQLQVTYAAAVLKDAEADLFKEIAEGLDSHHAATIFMHLPREARERFLSHLPDKLKRESPLTLRFQGFSHALQQHASVVQFAIENPPTNLSVGLPVSVIAQNGESVNAMIVPKDAVVRSANGEAIVWRHEAAEIFEPRPVRVTPFDASRVAIVNGVEKGDRVVVRGSDLVNQVR
jgi:multidrug efflux pump subunit AcrA (membrane-fusion protein)